MKKLLLLLLLIIVNLPLFAQRIETDIFNDLKYESENRQYQAKLKKDIFDNLLFSDNKNNKVSYNKKYLDLKHPQLAKNKESKIKFFRNLINRYHRETNNDVKYSVDIFDKIIIETNGDKTEAGKDIFGNYTYEGKINGKNTSVRKDLSGRWNYSYGNEKASLEKDIFNKWNYNDSSGNKIEFSEKTWSNLLSKYGREEDVFRVLIDTFFR
jgi:hypothetical protein